MLRLDFDTKWDAAASSGQLSEIHKLVRSICWAFGKFDSHFADPEEFRRSQIDPDRALPEGMPEFMNFYGLVGNLPVATCAPAHLLSVEGGLLRHVRPVEAGALALGVVVNLAYKEPFTHSMSYPNDFIKRATSTITIGRQGDSVYSSKYTIYSDLRAARSDSILDIACPPDIDHPQLGRTEVENLCSVLYGFALYASSCSPGDRPGTGTHTWRLKDRVS